MTFSLYRASRRLLALGLVAVAVLTPSAQAQNYPDRSVRLVVGFAPGGSDISGRIIAQKLSGLWGQSVVVDNKPGAGGNIGADIVAKAAPDGYTLLLTVNSYTINTVVYRNLSWDLQRDFEPLGRYAISPMVVVVNEQLPVKTMGELLAEARAKPGVLNIGTIATGSTQNLSGELFKSSANIDARIVPYRTTPDVILAAMRGDVDLIVDSYASMKSNLEDNKLRALGTSSINRSVALPNVPTVAEGGVPGFDVTSWNAIFAPAGTPQPVIDVLNKGILEVLAMPETKKQLLDLGIEAKGSTPAELGDKLKADIAKWTAIIDKSGIEKQ